MCEAAGTTCPSTTNRRTQILARYPGDPCLEKLIYPYSSGWPFVLTKTTSGVECQWYRPSMWYVGFCLSFPLVLALVAFITEQAPVLRFMLALMLPFGLCCLVAAMLVARHLTETYLKVPLYVVNCHSAILSIPRAQLNTSFADILSFHIARGPTSMAWLGWHPTVSELSVIYQAGPDIFRCHVFTGTNREIMRHAAILTGQTGKPLSNSDKRTH